MKKQTISKSRSLIVLTLASAGIAALLGWNADAEQSKSAPPVFLPLGMSINQLMVAVVDDAAHGIWEGGNKNEPLNEDEWEEVRMNAFQLQATATLVSLGGTGAADQGWVISPGFQEWARKLSDAATSARNASTAKNQVALRAAGDRLVEVCEGCHAQFKPSVPTEGILLKRGHPGANY